MFNFLYKRLINNKWLFLCLLLGAISTTAIMSAIPMYTNGILQRVLTKDLENAHVANQSSPGRYSVLTTGDGTFDVNFLDKVNQFDTVFRERYKSQYDLPIEEEVRQLRFERLILKRLGDDFYSNLNLAAYPTAIDDYEDKVVWLYGNAPSDEPIDSVYEVAVSENALKRLQLLRDETYTLYRENAIDRTETEMVQFKIVGVFSIEDKNSLFWGDGRYDSYQYNVVFTRKALESLFDGEKPYRLKDSENVVFYDYRSLRIERIQELIQTHKTQAAWLKSQNRLTYNLFPIVSLLNEYNEREKQLRTTLWILVIPLMIIMGFYAVIVSNLIVKGDKNEIAMLKSRGAKRGQIFMLYLGECGFIAAIAMIVGPFLGIGICKLLGASNGFLEFVSRTTLDVRLTPEIYLYALLATLTFCLFVLIPVIKASGIQIVQYKRSLLGGKKPLWQKLFIDVILLGISIYGLNQFRNRQEVLAVSGLKADELKIDPLLFFISTLFIVGVSLIFLRIYPKIVNVIFKIGQRQWHPVLFYSLVNVAKADKNMQAIMLFLMLSISFGIINANQARTINENTIDRVAYSHGAQVVIEPYNNLLHQGTPPPYIAAEDLPPVAYVEPPYKKFQALDFAHKMTKVYVEEKVRMSGGVARVQDMTIYGITPNEFGEIAWFRDDLLPHHINAYLNLMAPAPKAILLSSNMAEDFGIKVGDTVYADFPGLGVLDCMVYGFIDYFPTYYPYSEEGRNQYMGVMHASYISDKLPLHPYEIWIEKKEDTLDGDVLTQLKEANLRVEAISYMNQDIIIKKNDPMLLGTNGILTMCFMIEMLIAAVGFVIFWVLSIRERSLKFGIFRAIGMPMSQVGWIMFWEQLLVSGSAIVMGFMLGSISSRLFIPLLEVVYSSAQQVPKFKIVALQSDYLKVVIVTLIMVAVGLVILYRQIKGLKVNQVIKLGEDS